MGQNAAMRRDVAYDMMLEVEGLLRSESVRVTLDHELELGETFQMHGRRWVVAETEALQAKAVDRRLIAREAVDIGLASTGVSVVS
jgi:hypothetical protein